jgi:bifunctional DNA-binding transcriptional regulator/antitoxin component of YhaV-PrlF toxin-antitoxin module
LGYHGEVNNTLFIAGVQYPSGFKRGRFSVILKTTERRKNMNITKKLLLVFCLMGAVRGGVPAREDSAPVEGLEWSMAVLRKSSPAYDSLPFFEPLTFTRRDAFQIYLKFEGEGFCYVILEDDEGKLPLVYKRTVSGGGRITLPEEDRDFLAAELHGTSRLYVIVSARPKQNLERLIDLYGKEDSPPSLDRSILSEVFTIRKSAASPSDTAETVPPVKDDRPMNGQMWRFESQETSVVTVTVRS